MWYAVPTLHNTVSAVGKESFMKRQQEETTVLYCRLSQDDGREGESNSIVNQELICRGWFLPPNTYGCGSFVVNWKAVVGKESKKPYNRWKSTQKELNFMKSIFEEMGGIYRQVGDYFIPNLVLPDDGNY